MERTCKEYVAVVGDRFADQDWRSEGRTVIVREQLPPNRPDGPLRYRVEVDENPKNSSTVGRRSVISGWTLAKRYKKISH